MKEKNTGVVNREKNNSEKTSETAQSGACAHACMPVVIQGSQ